MSSMPANRQSPTCRGQVFVASNPSTDNIRDILDGIVRITGLEGWDAREPRGGEYPRAVSPCPRLPLSPTKSFCPNHSTSIQRSSSEARGSNLFPDLSRDLLAEGSGSRSPSRGRPCVDFEWKAPSLIRDPRVERSKSQCCERQERDSRLERGGDLRSELPFGSKVQLREVKAKLTIQKASARGSPPFSKSPPSDTHLRDGRRGGWA